MIQIDYKDRRPLYEQVSERMKELILTGVLTPDQKIPSVRSMAVELSVTPNTIQRAYSELEKNGYIYTVTGRGNFVAPVTDLKIARRGDTLAAVKTSIEEAKAAGVPLQEIVEAAEAIYGGEDNDSN